MNKKDFKKGIEDIKNIRMTNAEKTHMLKSILSLPIKSPYMEHVSVFTFINSNYARIAWTVCFIFALTFGGTVYTSGASLPGDLLYPIKTKVVEPVLDIVNNTPIEKVAWEEEKITRRIEEAEALAEDGRLDEKKLKKLEREIEKNSHVFVKVVNIVASSTATSTSSAVEKARDLKQEFRRKINEREEIFNKDENKKDKEEVKREKKTMTADVFEKSGKKDEKSENNLSESRRSKQQEKINKLKNIAIKVLDDEDVFDDKDRNNNGRKERNSNNLEDK